MLLQLSQNRIYYCYSMHLKKITKYTMSCRTRFDRMCWFPKLTCCCWPRRKQIVSTMYKNNNIFNCFTWVKIEWWLFIGIYMVTFMIPLSLTDNNLLTIHFQCWIYMVHHGKLQSAWCDLSLLPILLYTFLFFHKDRYTLTFKNQPRMQFEPQQIYFLYFPWVVH